jgi:hypothetical protein
MDRNSKLIILASVVIVAFLLQIVLIISDHHESPGKAAVEFSKSYFKLSEAMTERLCNEITEDGESEVVNDYLNRVADEARANGFDFSWMKMSLSHIELETQMVDENTAEVQITCHRRRAANPLYGTVAKIFSLGETHKVEETLTLVKEDERWKVCGQPFALIEG